MDKFEAEEYIEMANEIDRLRAALDEALEVVKPFGESYVALSTDDHGWTSGVGKERIVDWFGPSDFRAARRFYEKHRGDSK